MAVAITEKGRRAKNEDAVLCMELPGVTLLAVADGLGGHARGEIASRIAVENLRGMAGEGVAQPEEFFIRAYRKINSEIKAVAGEIGAEGMATTLTSALVDSQGNCTLANLGDSRGYVVSRGRVVLKTKDHSLVQVLVERGEITEEEAYSHPMKHLLTRALGIEERADPDLYHARLQAGDVLLLSTDGLHDYLREEEVVETVRSHRGEQEIAEALMRKALKLSEDNISVAVLRWQR